MDTIEVTIELDEEEQSPVIPVTPLGENRFRLEDDPWDCVEVTREKRKHRPRVKDVIEAQVLGPGRLRFVRVVERARMKRSSYLVDPQTVASPHLERVLQRVLDLGGHWVRIAEGVLIVHLPRECEYDLWADYDRMRAEGSLGTETS